MNKIKDSELILNKDGSIYHLKLKPGDLAKDIITVGDPERAKDIAKRFDQILIKKQNREFLSITGKIGRKKISVISTGIGTDNIDIVFTEIDALFNINFRQRKVKEKLTSLNFYRIGTSGSIHEEVPVDSLLMSVGAIGLEGLGHFYNYRSPKIMVDQFSTAVELPSEINPYYVPASQIMIQKFAKCEFKEGITLTANGFYNPQGRTIRLKSKFAENLKKCHNLKLKNKVLSNLEMETSGIYLLSHLLKHNAISLNAILANRVNGEFSQKPKKTVSLLIEKSLEIISK